MLELSGDPITPQPLLEEKEKQKQRSPHLDIATDIQKRVTEELKESKVRRAELSKDLQDALKHAENHTLDDVVRTEISPEKTELCSAPVKETKQLPHISGYTLIKEIGAGGFATVYLAEKEGKQYAIKVFHAEHKEALPSIEKRIKELNTRELKDNGIIQVEEYDFTSSQPYTVMKYAGEKLSTGTTRSVREKVELLRKIFTPVAAAHEKGVEAPDRPVAAYAIICIS